MADLLSAMSVVSENICEDIKGCYVYNIQVCKITMQRFK